MLTGDGIPTTIRVDPRPSVSRMCPGNPGTLQNAAGPIAVPARGAYNRSMTNQELPEHSAEPLAQDGDTVLLVGEDQKRSMIKLQRGNQWHTNRGLIRHDDLIGQPLGRMVVTQMGHAFPDPGAIDP